MSVNYKFVCVNDWALFLMKKSLMNQNPIGEGSEINTNELIFRNYKATIIRRFNRDKTLYLIEVRCSSKYDSYNLKCDPRTESYRIVKYNPDFGFS